MQSCGEGPEKAALSERFKSYCWIFTDTLIDKLVELRLRAWDVRPRGRAVAQKSSSVSTKFGVLGPEDNLEGGEASRARGEHPAREMGEARRAQGEDIDGERSRAKEDILREITGFASSSELLRVLHEIWLPQVLESDERNRT